MSDQAGYLLVRVLFQANGQKKNELNSAPTWDLDAKLGDAH